MWKSAYRRSSVDKSYDGPDSGKNKVEGLLYKRLTGVVAVYGL